MYDIYYEHQRFFAPKRRAERLGHDNVQSSISYELSYILNCIVNGLDYTRAYKEDIDYFNYIKYRIDCEGYEANAMA